MLNPNTVQNMGQPGARKEKTKEKQSSDTHMHEEWGRPEQRTQTN